MSVLHFALFYCCWCNCCFRNFFTAFQNGYANLHLYQQWSRVPFSPYPYQYLLEIFFVFCFLISIQTYWNEVISPWALIYISLRISEIELFVLGTYWPLYFPLEKKSPFKATAHFLIRFFFLLLSSYTEYKVNVQNLAPLLYVNSALSETKRNQESNVISKNYKK